jgi:hypothetical protein
MRMFCAGHFVRVRCILPHVSDLQFFGCHVGSVRPPTWRLALSDHQQQVQGMHTRRLGVCPLDFKWDEALQSLLAHAACAIVSSVSSVVWQQLVLHWMRIAATDKQGCRTANSTWCVPCFELPVDQMRIQACLQLRIRC